MKPNICNRLIVIVIATGVSVPRGLLADTVKARTFLAHLHHASMEAPATRTLKPATRATACQVGGFELGKAYTLN